MTREDWLLAAIDRLRPLYKQAGLEIPASLRVACGFPSRAALSNKNRRLGECWIASACEDGTNQIFVTPLVAKRDKALAILAHELIHAVLPENAGHKKPFVSACGKLGLEGPMKNAEPGPELTAKIEELTADLGEYPNSALVPKTAEKKQSCRMLKLFCRTNEDHEKDYIVRASKQCIEIGLPTCPCGKEMEVEEKDEEEAG